MSLNIDQIHIRKQGDSYSVNYGEKLDGIEYLDVKEVEKLARNGDWKDLDGNKIDIGTYDADKNLISPVPFGLMNEKELEAIKKTKAAESKQ